MTDDTIWSWLLDLPGEHETAFRDEVEELGGTVTCLARFPGDDGTVVSLDVVGGVAVACVIKSYCYLGLRDL